MASRPLSSFLPTADDVTRLHLPKLGEILLVHLNSYEGRVKQNGLLNRGYLLAMLENRNVGLGPLPDKPEYGARQPEVTRAVMEAWNWLEKEGILIRDPQQSAEWYSISRKGEELIARHARFERLEKLGLDRVKHDLLNGGFRVVGGPPEHQEEAWEWVRMKEGQAMLSVGRRAGTNGLPPLPMSGSASCGS